MKGREFVAALSLSVSLTLLRFAVLPCGVAGLNTIILTDGNAATAAAKALSKTVATLVMPLLASLDPRSKTM